MKKKEKKLLSLDVKTVHELTNEQQMQIKTGNPGDGETGWPPVTKPQK